MLRVQTHALRAGAVETAAEIQPDDPLLDGLEFSLDEPLRVRGRLSESGPGRLYWHGEIRTGVTAACRRCLAQVRMPVTAEIRAVFTTHPADDDASVYAIDPATGMVDLAPVVREELVLVVPEYVLCREGCRGLCPRCGKDLNEGPCDCRPEAEPRWEALDALRQSRSDDER
jgi:uncharacterized protein